VPWRGRSSATLSASGQVGGAEGRKIYPLALVMEGECECVSVFVCAGGGQVVSLFLKKVVIFFASMGYLRLQGLNTTDYIGCLLTSWDTNFTSEFTPGTPPPCASVPHGQAPRGGGASGCHTSQKESLRDGGGGGGQETYAICLPTTRRTPRNQGWWTRFPPFNHTFSAISNLMLLNSGSITHAQFK